MKDYYATLKIQQGRLKAAMRELGIVSVAELSRRCGVSQRQLGDFLNFRLSPRRARGRWRDAVLRICKVLGAEPSDIFPDHLDHELPTNRIAAFVEHGQLAATSARQLGPADECEAFDRSRVLSEVLGTLSEREQRILKARFWDGDTLSDVGRAEGVSSEAIRRCQTMAFSKLRHPERLRRLSGFVD